MGLRKRKNSDLDRLRGSIELGAFHQTESTLEVIDGNLRGDSNGKHGAIYTRNAKGCERGVRIVV